MKGYVYRRAKGSWTIVYDLGSDAVTGKRRQKFDRIFEVDDNENSDPKVSRF